MFIFFILHSFFQVENLKVRLVTLDTIDERIKQLDEFNGLFKDFDAVVKEFEAWLGVGRLVVETK